MELESLALYLLPSLAGLAPGASGWLINDSRYQSKGEPGAGPAVGRQAAPAGAAGLVNSGGFGFRAAVLAGPAATSALG